MRDLLFFEKMFIPKVITFIYWLMLFLAVITGISTWVAAGFGIGGFFIGILMIAASIVFARIWCELIIVLFKMNEALQEIKNNKAVAVKNL